MRKTKMVTRSIAFTEAQLLCINMENATATRQVTVPGSGLKEKAILKEANRILADESSGMEAIRVLSTRVSEQLFGMPEETFIANATVLPPRKTNAETVTETETEND